MGRHPQTWPSADASERPLMLTATLLGEGPRGPWLPAHPAALGSWPVWDQEELESSKCYQYLAYRHSPALAVIQGHHVH